jgi:uncharacterized glyoxalase superfamily protein PhnB
MKLKKFVPVIATLDVKSAVDYYCGVLGFSEHFVFGDPPVYAGVEQGGVLLYLALDVELATMIKNANLHPEVFLWVQDVDAAFIYHKDRGAKIVEEIADRAWDARQYVIEDPAGYHLKIAQPIDEIDET